MGGSAGHGWLEALGPEDAVTTLSKYGGPATSAPTPQVENNFLTPSREADDLIGLFPSLAFIEKLQFIIG